MRQLFAFGILLLLCGLASGQDAWVSTGAYSQPFVPRLATPIASPGALATPSLALDSPTLTVGASNATLNSPTGSAVRYNQPLFYEPGMQASSFLNNLLPSPAEEEAAFGASAAAPGHFELGAARFQGDYGVAQLESKRPRGNAVRVYTNADIARLNDANGTIRYGDKLAHLN